jgi:hypothetical protein
MANDDARVERIYALTRQIERLRIAATKELNQIEERRAGQARAAEAKARSQLLIAARYTPGGLGVDLKLPVEEIFKRAKRLPRVREIHAWYLRSLKRINDSFKVERQKIRIEHESAIKSAEAKIDQLFSVA